MLGLGDVSQGGLGSFSLANMVIAHLQEEEKVCLAHFHPTVEESTWKLACNSDVMVNATRSGMTWMG